MADDHVHMCISISPKYAVSVPEVIGYLKGKSAIAMLGSLAVGFELDKIRDYIRRQEHEEDQGVLTDNLNVMAVFETVPKRQASPLWGAL